MDCAYPDKKYGCEGASLAERHAINAMFDELIDLLARRVAPRILQDERDGEFPKDAEPAE